MTRSIDWFAQVVEETIEPERPIVDPHFHLWQERPPFVRYLLEDLWADTGTGHRVEQMVFLECHSEYLTDGPEAMRPVGETRFVAAAASRAEAQPAGRTRIGGIVGTADLMLGAGVDAVLEAQLEAGCGRFRGIRHSASWDASDEVANASSEPIPSMYGDAVFREGFARLAHFGLSFDAWNFHPQILELAALARAFPETCIVSNHLGSVIGIGPYRDRRDEIFDEWKRSLSVLSKCPNVVMKLGGMAQPVNGYDWESGERPPTSEEFADTYLPYYLHAIESFGPDRCMFESNFPVDRISVSYHVLWNAFKKMVADCSADEKEAMFRGTAMRVYRLEPVPE